MSSRREFLRRTAELSAFLFASIERAAAIQPTPGSTFRDAEHVVILMQENRSFDHSFGTLRGVRGFGDPRAVTLPNGRPVWAQTGKDGKVTLPFRLDLKRTKSTWLGALPHGWSDQTDARNDGNNDGWIDAKKPGRKECAHIPLTMGFHTREDIPFYYALADAFTVCDQYFCSSLTGTTPNRLYLWTGTARDQRGKANVWNHDVTYTSTANWTTYPERLEEAGISWRIYQNELSLPTGLEGEQRDWLENFTNNPIEWFDQYHVGFRKTYQQYMRRALAELPAEIAAMRANPNTSTGELEKKEKLLAHLKAESVKWSPEAQAKVSARERSLHAKAFTTNDADPHYREIEKIRYKDGGAEREMFAPKGDVLYQFRADVESGRLPKVSWLIAPRNFSDHPGAPWYGAWYLAEVMNILTRNPAVWKKTIFILTYDENDGYFDHIPPFAAPHPTRPESGKVTDGINAAEEHWSEEEDRKGVGPKRARGGPIGLGFRVPFIVASPWTRGGYVNSQIFDHTSVIQFLEKLYGVQEPNISAWRRTVCGDLTSIFRPEDGRKDAKLPYLPLKEFLSSIHQAQFRPLPTGWESSSMPRQEKGTRPSLPLPYEHSAEAVVRGEELHLYLKADTRRFGDRSAGAAFHVYTPGLYRQGKAPRVRSYAVEAGKQLSDAWAIEGFPDQQYELRVCGANGFFRAFRGTKGDPKVQVACLYEDADVVIAVYNHDDSRAFTVLAEDQSYGSGIHAVTVQPGTSRRLRISLAKSTRWYDLRVTIEGVADFERHYAGRVETGEIGISDPAMA
jgi:phospholipase C